MIIEDDRFDGTDSVVVCLMTSTEAAMPLLRVPVPADEVSGHGSTQLGDGRQDHHVASVSIDRARRPTRGFTAS
jgi:hypothetical protein